MSLARSGGRPTAGEIDLVLDFYLGKPDVPRLQADPNLKWVRGRNVPAKFGGSRRQVGRNASPVSR